jgi:hypothetical protein
MVGCPPISVQPLQFLLLIFAGWVNRKQLEVIDYLTAVGLGSPMTSADGIARGPSHGSIKRQ